jgi:hypothetical protein
VEDCGGWQAVCACDTLSILKAQYQAAYARRAASRRAEQVLHLRESRQRPDLFPPWERELLCSAAPTLPPAEPEPGEIVPIPQVTRQLLAGVGQTLPEEEKGSHDAGEG